MESKALYYRVCAFCNQKFESISYVKYCSEECRLASNLEQKRRRLTKAEKQKSLEERIAHQKDPSIWNHEYAQRQKAKTIELYGRINLDEYQRNDNG